MSDTLISKIELPVSTVMTVLAEYVSKTYGVEAASSDVRFEVTSGYEDRFSSSPAGLTKAVVTARLEPKGNK